MLWVEARLETDHSPFVHLRMPIKTRGLATFRDVGRAAHTSPSEPSPGAQSAAGFTQGNDPVL
jgi:hypothetical protein